MDKRAIEGVMDKRAIEGAMDQGARRNDGS
jgi:hypothetical protein